MASDTSSMLTRRTVLRGAVASVASGMLAACAISPAVTDAPTPAPPPTAPPTTDAATVATPTPAPLAAAPTATAMPTTTPLAPGAISLRATPPTGELRIAVASFPNTLDALKETNVLRFGIGETLMRLTPQYELEPWLAERVVNVDPLTWRVTLRSNAKFHDGSPVTAEDVVAAFRRNYDAYPNADGLVSKDTRITAVDATTIELKTPQPTGVLPNALTSSYFIIHKPRAAGGADGTILTGPYRGTSLAVDNELVLEPFADHWMGPPPIARITIKKVVDPNSEVLALQSGETDLIFRVPPEVVRGLSADFTVAAIPSALVDSVNINFARPPLDDRAVREAWAWGIDRNVFVNVALDGQGVPAAGVFPPNLRVESVPVQGLDLDRARRALDDAGWKAGPDGVRVKDGKQLAFTLLNPDPSQPELAAMSVSMQGQLKVLGFNIQLQQAQESSSFTKNGNFDAMMRSNNSVQTGDPLFQLSRTFGKGGASNTGNYGNSQIEELLTQLRGELDPTKRQTLSRQIQQLAGNDVPDIFLAVVPIVSVYRTAKVKNFVPHPDDNYLINSAVSVS